MQIPDTRSLIQISIEQAFEQEQNANKKQPPSIEVCLQLPLWVGV